MKLSLALTSLLVGSASAWSSMTMKAGKIGTLTGLISACLSAREEWVGERQSASGLNRPLPDALAFDRWKILSYLCSIDLVASMLL
jgi:hypothetical protein